MCPFPFRLLYMSGVGLSIHTVLLMQKNILCAAAGSPSKQALNLWSQIRWKGLHFFHGSGGLPCLFCGRTTRLTLLIFLYEKPVPVWKTRHFKPCLSSSACAAAGSGVSGFALCLILAVQNQCLLRPALEDRLNNLCKHGVGCMLKKCLFFALPLLIGRGGILSGLCFITKKAAHIT